MNFEEYLAIDAVNWSTLKAMRQSPLAYKAAVESPRQDRDAFRLGRATHCSVFEPLEFVTRYRIWSGERRAGKVWEAFRDECEAEHVTPLTRDQWQRAQTMADAVRGCPLVAPMLADGLAEHVVTWTDEKTGIACKGRLDWLAPGLVLDLKTARNATNPRAFAAAAWSMGYFHQMAWYARGAGVERARIVAVEPEPPHDVAVYELHEDGMHLADTELDALLDKVKVCRETNVFPGALASVIDLNPPRYAWPDAENLDVYEPAWAEGAGL